jgi:glycosyltransferase involved in cell wall biosynthesis
MNDRRRTADVWPAVSVILPTRDRPEALRRAVNSVLDQDYPGPVGCVVIFDRTPPVVLPDPKRPGRTIQAIENTGAPGPAGARNCGVRTATGELVAFCDDDDRWMPGKLRAQVAAFRAQPDASAVSCGVLVRYRGRSVARVPSQDRVHFEDLTRSRFTEIHTSTLLVRRDDYLGPIGPFDETMPDGYGEDYEWLLRATRWRPLLVVLRPLVRIDWHEASWFDRRWETIIAGIHRLLERHPEIEEDRIGLARLYGRLAFAHAAAGRARDARVWSRRAISLNWRERRAYLALAVAARVVRARTVVGLAHRAGRGV